MQAEMMKNQKYASSRDLKLVKTTPSIAGSNRRGRMLACSHNHGRGLVRRNASSD